MKKPLLLITLILIVFVPNSKLFAQSTYKTAVGLGIDFGNGGATVGPTIKHFFNDKNALQGEILLGDGYFSLGAFYQYHQSFKEAPELKWYLGVGPQVFLDGDANAAFALRPMAGLDYKIKTLPLSVNIDFRPIVFISDGLEFEAARFGFGLKYVFK
ncbi:hypothetical protein [Mucilaginibacter arboris]|uniref:Outer membrane insertion C-signal n=1 Tax=Mucilaginibacter arboris TaxID=2682090 RepID=A0A7K1SUW0_9SPHI|nr:hypothetical protein [Mucilaginibacter arboris]MVN21129.1 hypothetical protein [Mucilaginibacter arboris]